MKMKTLKEGIVIHADGLGKLFKFSAEILAGVCCIAWKSLLIWS